MVDFAGAVVGDELSQPFTGKIELRQASTSTPPGLPNSAAHHTAAGKAVTIPVTVHNTGTAPQDFFVDARLNQTSGLTLAAAEPTTVPVPIPGDLPSPAWLVPSETTGVAVVGNATQPIMFDYGPDTGDPDLPSAVNGTTAVGTVQGNPLTSGLWSAVPSELGPTPAAGGPAGTVTFTAVAQTKAFDPAVTATATDLWQGSVATDR